LNRPFGRSRELSCGFHFGHPLKIITPWRLDYTLTAGNLPTSPRRRFGKVTSTPAIATTTRFAWLRSSVYWGLLRTKVTISDLSGTRERVFSFPADELRNVPIDTVVGTVSYDSSVRY
jgi:hypothetical protein